MEDIFFTCPCTGQTFTSSEWHEYLISHPANEIVKTVNGFEYNVNGVCMNPKLALQWEHNHNYFKVETAQSENGRWSFGIHWWFGNSGGCCGACYVPSDKNGYTSEKDAIIDALNVLETNARRG